MPSELMTSIEIEAGVQIAFHAGGYLVHQARPVLERLFKRRFAGESAPDVATAASRLEPFFAQLQKRVEKLEERDGLTHARIAEQFAKPEVTGTFYKAVENAMETDDELVRSTLVELIVQRISAADQSVWAHATRMAIERVRDLTPNQIRLLGLISFLHEDFFGVAFEMIPDSQREPYIQWLSQYRELIELEREPTDLDHLSGLGLISYGPMYSHLEGGFTPRPLNAVALRFPDIRGDARVSGLIDRVGDFASSLRDDDHVVLAAIDLTPPGVLIGAHAMRQLAKKE